MGFREEAFRWTRGTGIVGLGLPPLSKPEWALSYALGVSGNGEVAVGGANFQRPHGRVREAFRWTHGAGMVGLGHLPGTQVYSDAFGASADGTVIVGGSNSVNGDEAFRWTQATGMVGLGDLAGGRFSSNARATTLDGNVVVGHGAANHGLEAFRWTQATGMVGLGILPGDSHSDAHAVSFDGSIIVGKSGDTAFRWTPGTAMVAIGSLGGESSALGISAEGTVIVGYDTDFSVGGHAAIWHPVFGDVSMYDLITNEFGLNLTGWTLSEATSISADGMTIVGSGRNPLGDYEAWMFQVPEPKTAVLMASVALIAFRRGRSW
jgi:probable HAF family extracellular repeat protein